MSPAPERNSSPPKAPEIILRIFGLAFGGIGVTMLVFMWGSSFDEFGSPPLFFRVFASFIAIPFVAFGAAALFGKLSPTSTDSMKRLASQARQLHDELQAANPGDRASAAPTSYTCPHCSAPLGSQADVSPHGDVKCVHCGAWFNIHG